MPQPTGTDLYHNPLLTNVAVAYIQSQTDFVAHRAFPEVPVDLQGGLYTEFPRGDWMRSVARKRGPGTESQGSGWRQERKPYFTEVYAIHKDISSQDRANDELMTLDPLASQFVARQLLLQREIDWATRYMTTGVWTGITTGVASSVMAGQFLQWNDANSTPIRDIRNAALARKEATGFRPNKLALGPYAWEALIQHPKVLERMAITQTRVATTALLAQLFDLDEVMVPFGSVNTAAEGDADVISFIAGKSALLFYAPPQPGMFVPSAGYTFTWRGFLGAVGGTRVVRFPMRELSSDRVEGESAYAQHLVAADLGHYFATAVA